MHLFPSALLALWIFAFHCNSDTSFHCESWNKTTLWRDLRVSSIPWAWCHNYQPQNPTDSEEVCNKTGSIYYTEQKKSQEKGTYEDTVT